MACSLPAITHCNNVTGTLGFPLRFMLGRTYDHFSFFPDFLSPRIQIFLEAEIVVVFELPPGLVSADVAVEPHVVSAAVELQVAASDAAER